jgi:ABC-type sulfate transport system permease component
MPTTVIKIRICSLAVFTKLQIYQISETCMMSLQMLFVAVVLLRAMRGTLKWVENMVLLLLHRLWHSSLYWRGRAV